MYEGNGLKLMREFYAKYNIVNFPGGNTGAQMGGWFRKEIKTRGRPEGPEVPHRRLRRQGGRALGACRRICRAARSTRRWKRARSTRPNGSARTTTRSSASYKVAPYYYYPGWWEGGPAAGFLHQPEGLDALSAEYKAIVEAALRHAHIDMQAKYDARNPGALKQLVAGGTKVLPFPATVLEASFKASMDLYEEIAAKNPDWKKIYGDYRAFQRDQILWFRFAESRFDTFMQTRKM
jgi:TRAP-type mannitol/chloroaromatic compound transport system substrate-binding protein